MTYLRLTLEFFVNFNNLKTPVACRFVPRSMRGSLIYKYKIFSGMCTCLQEPLTHWDIIYNFQNHIKDKPLNHSQVNTTADSTLLNQVMAWCRQTRSYYLNQCWPSFPAPCSVTSPQWVETFSRTDTISYVANALLPASTFDPDYTSVIKRENGLYIGRTRDVFILLRWRHIYMSVSGYRITDELTVC